MEEQGNERLGIVQRCKECFGNVQRCKVRRCYGIERQRRAGQGEGKAGRSTESRTKRRNSVAPRRNGIERQ